MHDVRLHGNSYIPLLQVHEIFEAAAGLVAEYVADRSQDDAFVFILLHL